MARPERFVEYMLSIGASGCFITGIVLLTTGSVGAGIAGGLLLLTGLGLIVARIRAHAQRYSAYEAV